jgi:hypothetical protein
LTQEQLKEYSIMRAKNDTKREPEDSDKSDNEEEDDEGENSSDVRR